MENNAENEMTIDGFQLVKTCSICPEQYDVYRGGDKVGYLRLRHGEFNARVPSSEGVVVYESETIGYGEFEEWERIGELTAAIAAIKAHLDQK